MYNQEDEQALRKFSGRFFTVTLRRVTKQLAAQLPTYLETASFQVFREDHDLGRVDADSNERVDVLMTQLPCLRNELNRGR